MDKKINQDINMKAVWAGSLVRTETTSYCTYSIRLHTPALHGNTKGEEFVPQRDKIS